MEILVSFSQEYEDIRLFHMLYDYRYSINWIDVGANDPIYLSVTKLFSLYGGTGINIEPQHNLIEKLIIDRPNDINVEAGISNQKGEMVLYGSGTGGSFDKDNIVVKGLKETIVPVTTLNDILDSYGSELTDIHFLKVDVEGFERQCFEGIDFKRYRPWIVLAESYSPENGKPTYDQWENILLDNNYVYLGEDGINRYYVSKEKKDCIKEFMDYDSLNTLYKIISYDCVKDIKRKKKKNGRLYQWAITVYYSRLGTPIKWINRKVKARFGKEY